MMPTLHIAVVSVSVSSMSRWHTMKCRCRNVVKSTVIRKTFLKNYFSNLAQFYQALSSPLHPGHRSNTQTKDPQKCDRLFTTEHQLFRWTCRYAGSSSLWFYAQLYLRQTKVVAQLNLQWVGDQLLSQQDLTCPVFTLSFSTRRKMLRDQPSYRSQVNPLILCPFSSSEAHLPKPV